MNISVTPNIIYCSTRAFAKGKIFIFKRCISLVWFSFSIQAWIRNAVEFIIKNIDMFIHDIPAKKRNDKWMIDYCCDKNSLPSLWFPSHHSGLAKKIMLERMNFWLFFTIKISSFYQKFKISDNLNRSKINWLETGWKQSSWLCGDWGDIQGKL